MFALIASALIALASVFGSAPVEAPVSAPVEQFQPFDAPAEVNPFAGMTAAECGELPDYQSTKDCALALWSMGTLDLPKCVEEDHANCVFRSNYGSDFIDINGFAYFLPEVMEA